MPPALRNLRTGKPAKGCVLGTMTSAQTVPFKEPDAKWGDPMGEIDGLNGFERQKNEYLMLLIK